MSSCLPMYANLPAYKYNLAFFLQQPVSYIQHTNTDTNTEHDSPSPLPKPSLLTVKKWFAQKIDGPVCCDIHTSLAPGNVSGIPVRLFHVKYPSPNPHHVYITHNGSRLSVVHTLW
ncbi:hypothetical protein BaRGS_00012662 [Batillaria attramentaria]|uniref:Uncharacterized protein n=1 Tax=Batillaria attramentaria TaxID=370345 RepID=A0ABD0L9I2_9CAEN